MSDKPLDCEGVPASGKGKSDFKTAPPIKECAGLNKTQYQILTGNLEACKEAQKLTVKEHTSLDGVWSQAEYSACGKYRYFLTRKIDDTKKPLCFIMLNPSTATEEQNDPTVERCQRRALSAGYGGIIILNLFAYRAADPKDMKVQADPVGPHNDRFIDEALHDSKYGILDIVCGWGCHGTHMDREKAVLEMFTKYQIQPKALEWTKAGHPKHPLYIPYSARPHERA